MRTHLIVFVFIRFSASFIQVIAEEMAKVIDARGKVTVLRKFRKLPVSKGDLLQARDNIYTGDNSSVKLKLADGSVTGLGQNGQLKLKKS